MKKFSGIRAISFDGDQTLWDFRKVMRHSLHYTLKELEQIDPQAAALLDIDKMIEIRDRVAEELKGRVTSLEAVRLEAFRQTLAENGRPDDTLASHLNEVYLKHRFEDIELYQDVMPVLQKLKVKYTVGLLSNGNSYPERCGLEGIFQFVVFSQDHGFEKPDPKFFQIAIEKAGCSREELLHVGDSLQNDIIGANNAGIKCIWLNRENEINTSGCKIDYEIHSLWELLKILPDMSNI
jgi:2-haloalkanoic acid dehalogenase type II